MTDRLGISIDWEELAWDHGFRGQYATMLQTWYTDNRMTQEEIGRRLGLSGSAISKQLRSLCIEIVPPRNPNCGKGARL